VGGIKEKRLRDVASDNKFVRHAVELTMDTRRWSLWDRVTSRKSPRRTHSCPPVCLSAALALYRPAYSRIPLRSRAPSAGYFCGRSKREIKLTTLASGFDCTAIRDWKISQWSENVILERGYVANRQIGACVKEIFILLVLQCGSVISNKCEFILLTENGKNYKPRYKLRNFEVYASEGCSPTVIFSYSSEASS